MRIRKRHTISKALSDFGRLWGQLLLVGIVTRLTATLLMVPVLAAVVRIGTGWNENTTVSDAEMVDIFLQPLGIVTLAGLGVIWVGVAMVEQAGFMTVYYARDGGGSAATGSSQIDRIDVRDKVYIRSDDQEATADRGVFNMKSEVVELTGKQVVLSQGGNVLVGCKLTVFLKTSEARVERCPNAGGTSSGRVRMQIDPNSRKK